MKFNEWETCYEQGKRTSLFGSRSTLDVGLFYEELGKLHIEMFPNGAPKEDAARCARPILERKWYAESRPYYKVFPAITQSLWKFKCGDINTNDINIAGKAVLLARFALGSEPTYRGHRVCCLLIGKLTTAPLYCLWKTVDENGHASIFGFGVTSGIVTITGNECPEPEHMRIIGFAAAISLLANDPSIITPDVLSSDRDRYERETDEAWKQRAVDRARRRGVVGWNIGADYEVCPHYRRPHFGLRHTGKGKTVPRIVPIKGAVVHRSRLTEVPTGYILPDGTEVEGGKAVTHD